MTTKTGTRDIHSPANVKPEDYFYLDMIWLGDPEKGPDNDAGTMSMIDDSSYVGNFARKGTCDHCGAHFLYGAVFQHTNQDVIVVGNVCADQVFGEDDKRALDLRRTKDAAAYARASSSKAQQVAALLEENPGLDEALKTEHYIVEDINARLLRHGAISEKQIALVFKIAREANAPKTCEFCDEVGHEVDHCPHRGEVAEGRREVCGRVLGTKWRGDDWGGSLKMLVLLDDGSKVWGSCPDLKVPDYTRVTERHEITRGDRISFRGTFKRSKGDPHFGFFSRPSNASLLVSSNNAGETR